MAPKEILTSLPETGTVCPALDIIPTCTPPDLYSSSLLYFRSIPWTRKLLTSPVPDTQQQPVIPFIPSGRNPIGPEFDCFLGKTLFTAITLPYLLSYFVPQTPSHLTDPSLFIDRVTTLVRLGPEVTSWKGVVHGGLVATLMDEAMSQIPELNTLLRKKSPNFGTPALTGGLEVKFLKPVPAESVVKLECWIERVEGRKTRVACELSGEEGTVMARGLSTWVAVRSNI